MLASMHALSRIPRRLVGAALLADLLYFVVCLKCGLDLARGRLSWEAWAPFSEPLRWALIPIAALTLVAGGAALRSAWRERTWKERALAAIIPGALLLGVPVALWLVFIWKVVIPTTIYEPPVF